MQLTNPRTGEVILEKQFEAMPAEKKSKLLTDINWYRRLLGKFEKYIKDYIKDNVELDEDNTEATFGYHKVTLVTRSYMNKSKMSDEDKETFEGLQKKYNEPREYIVIK